MEFRHVGIIVKDIKISKKFYVNTLGLKKVVSLTEKGTYLNKLISTNKLEAKVVKLKTKCDTIIEIIEFSKKNLQSRKNFMDIIGTMHMCFTVKNIEKLYKKIKKKGYRCFSNPLESPYNPVSTFFCYDPDNNIVQYTEDH
tara:strand:+ start:72 stop:494 length:423 start_codon:yes stop_codon:yes gene_type:complete